MSYFCLLAWCSVGLEDADVFTSDLELSDSDTENACKYRQAMFTYISSLQGILLISFNYFC